MPMQDYFMAGRHNADSVQCYLTVAVIVYPVLIPIGSSCTRAIHLHRVHPQVVDQIRMGYIYTSVHHAHPDLQDRMHHIEITEA